MTLGTALHRIFLEPDKSMDRYLLIPDNMPKRLKVEDKKVWHSLFEEAKANNQKVIGYDLRGYDWEKMTGGSRCEGHVELFRRAHDIRSRIPEVDRIFNREHGVVEGTYCADLFGDCEVRVRPDHLNTRKRLVIYDLKSTGASDRRSFEREIMSRSLYVQAALYSDVVEEVLGERPLWLFFTIDKSRPQTFEPHFYPMDPSYLELGRKVYTMALDKYRRCRDNDDWPVIARKLPSPIKPPYYLTKEIEEEFGE